MFRVAKPSWANPLDTSHAKARGGRWNAPGLFDVLYLNATVEVARAQVQWMYEGYPYGPEDLEPAEAAVLLTVDVATADYVDAVTAGGLAALGLPSTYPLDETGKVVEWEPCQQVGHAMYEAGESGMACISAAPNASGEELALFARDGQPPATLVRIQTFDDWYWT
jgi:RES domain-containing protein